MNSAKPDLIGHAGAHQLRASRYHRPDNNIRRKPFLLDHRAFLENRVDIGRKTKTRGEEERWKSVSGRAAVDPIFPWRGFFSCSILSNRLIFRECQNMGSRFTCRKNWLLDLDSNQEPSG